MASSLAMEEAKRKANMSEAVRSLYESKNKGVKETFMTRGTFTRVSLTVCTPLDTDTVLMTMLPSSMHSLT